MCRTGRHKTFVQNVCGQFQPCVIRLSLGTRLVNLLRVAPNGVDDRPWVVGREFESHVHHENAFSRKVNFLKNLINHSPWVPRDCQELRTWHVRPHTKTKDPPVQKGGSVITLSLGRRLANLLPVAQRIRAQTNPNPHLPLTL